MTRLILILLGLAIGGPAMAQNEFNLSHGKTYYENCKSLLVPYKEYTTRDTACVFYFKGWVDSFVATQGVMQEAMGVAPSVCLPKGFTVLQGLNAVLSQMETRPLDTEPSAMVMMIVFMKTWPCAKKPVPRIERF